jgi:hypothetical protein
MRHHDVPPGKKSSPIALTITTNYPHRHDLSNGFRSLVDVLDVLLAVMFAA